MTGTPCVCGAPEWHAACHNRLQIGARAINGDGMVHIVALICGNQFVVLRPFTRDRQPFVVATVDYLKNWTPA